MISESVKEKILDMCSIEEVIIGKTKKTLMEKRNV